MPEAVSFILRTISLLAPIAQKKMPGQFPHTASDAFRISGVPADWKPRKPTFADMFEPASDTPLVVLSTLLDLVDRLAGVWEEKTAFVEAFEPAAEIMVHLSSKASTAVLGSALKVSPPPAPSPLWRGR